MIGMGEGICRPNGDGGMFPHPDGGDGGGTASDSGTD